MNQASSGWLNARDTLHRGLAGDVFEIVPNTRRVRRLRRDVGAAPGTFVHAVQRCAAPLSRLLDSGCDPSRQTGKSIDGPGFADSALSTFTVSRWTTILVGTTDR